MEKNYQQALGQVQAFQSRQQQLKAGPHQPGTERKLLWLSMQEVEAKKRVEKNSAVSRLPMQLKIVAWQASLQEAQQWLDALKSEGWRFTTVL